MQAGQIWLATHSLEAVEAAGQHATFIFERNEENRKVDALARLDTRPVLSALSRAVGSPAFSISQLLFVLVEGEGNIGERERFRNLANLEKNVRFMECGSCNEVMRRVEVIKDLAEEAESGIRIAGVVDRDFRGEAGISELLHNYGIYVLPVHEVENFFLHPTTLGFLLKQHGLQIEPLSVIQEASDSRAGSWIFQHAMAAQISRSLPEIPISSEKVCETANLDRS